MAKLLIRFPGCDDALCEELSVGQALLLGRSPDASRLSDHEVQVPRAALRTRSLPGATVSSNHLLVWCDALGVHLRDLTSRNGSWCQLPPGISVSLGTTHASEILNLELAPVPDTEVTTRPSNARWRDEDDFPAAVAREVARWLRALGHPLSATAVRRDAATRGWLPPLPLVGEWHLQLTAEASTGTIDPLWSHTVETLVAYVHDQRTEFQAAMDTGHPPGFVMASPAMREAHRDVCEAAGRGLPLILLGATGTGKGTLARCYHLHGPRPSGPFEAVNCAEIDRHFARTRLFGARKGAYTGCSADLSGAVECAHGGTLFLDELVELPLDVQGELLTFLDDQRYKRLGDDQWRRADLRLVCGTNSDLRVAVQSGRFRADLWYRLAGRVVSVAPLRERPEDLEAWLRRKALGEKSEARSVWEALSPEARRRVTQGHPWSGNFRELAAFAQRLPESARSESLGLEVCEAALREGMLEGDLLAPAPGREGWTGLLELASEAYFQRHQGQSPARAGDLKTYAEELLKPLFFARILEMEHLEALPERPSPSFEELARRLGCDGATVKSQLARYVELRKTLRSTKE